MDKNEYLKMLRSNDIFKQVLEKAPNDQERRAIKSYAEQFYMSVFNQLILPLNQSLQKDPAGLKNAFLEIEKELINSGSTEI